MGINNKQRRRMKQAKRQERRRATQDGYGPPRAQHGWHEEGVDLMIDLAIEAAIQADDPAKAPQLAVLVERDATIRARVVPRLQSWLAQVHRAALRHGWHTDEMARVARRRAGAAAADLVGGLVDGAPAAVDPSNPESWPATVAAAVGALAVMAHLPPLPDLGAVRRGAAPGVDERLLARVRALLAKAESTEFSQEAEACLAKAQALMARHSLDHLAIEGHAGEACPLEARRLWLDDPYLQAKALLAGSVASANRCRAVVSSELGLVTLVGRPEDLDAVELLFTSLLVHATDRMTAAAMEAGSGALATRARRPSFRRSFLVAYANRIGARLREAAEAALAEADREHGRSLLPVLARQSDEVEAAVVELFPGLVHQRIPVSDRAGWVAGSAAADLADLVVQPQLEDLLPV